MTQLCDTGPRFYPLWALFPHLYKEKNAKNDLKRPVMMTKWDDICWYIQNLESFDSQMLPSIIEIWISLHSAYLYFFLTAVCPQLDNISFVVWSHISPGRDRFWLIFRLSQARSMSIRAMPLAVSQSDEASSPTEYETLIMGLLYQKNVWPHVNANGNSPKMALSSQGHLHNDRVEIYLLMKNTYFVIWPK